MKKLLICALILTFALCFVACDSTPAETPTEAPTVAPTEAPTEEAAEGSTEKLTEVPTEEATEMPTEEATEAPTEEATEAPTEEPTEAPEPPVEPTAYYSAEQLSTMVPVNATVTLEGEYAHFLTGTADTVTNPSITLIADGEAFSDIIVIKYRTNCGSYGSNFWGTLLLNGTAEFTGNRRDSDNWFLYYTDGEWDVLILDMRRNMAGAQGVPDTDVTGGAPIDSVVYNFFGTI